MRRRKKNRSRSSGKGAAASRRAGAEKRAEKKRAVGGSSTLKRKNEGRGRNVSTASSHKKLSNEDGKKTLAVIRLGRGLEVKGHGGDASEEKGLRNQGDYER